LFELKAIRTMLFLLFDLDAHRYAIAATAIAEVLARGPVKAVPSTPAWISGLIDYRGTLVPVIDLPRLALGRAARELRSTRLVLAYDDDTNDATPLPPPDARTPTAPLIGLILEHATQIRRIPREAFTDSGIDTPNARWLGPVARDEHGLVQWVAPAAMLDPATRALLRASQKPPSQQSLGGMR
jgi:chemotaxis-related protein WspB